MNAMLQPGSAHESLLMHRADGAIGLLPRELLSTSFSTCSMRILATQATVEACPRGV